MNYKNLELFLEVINNYNMEFKKCPKSILYNNFKQNQFYVLKSFCELNYLIEEQYNEFELSNKGREFFNFLKKMKLIYK